MAQVKQQKHYQRQAAEAARRAVESVRKEAKYLKTSDDAELRQWWVVHCRGSLRLPSLVAGDDRDRIIEAIEVHLYRRRMRWSESGGQGILRVRDYCMDGPYPTHEDAVRATSALTLEYGALPFGVRCDDGAEQDSERKRVGLAWTWDEA